VLTPAPGATTASLTLDGSRSYDPDGDALAYHQWETCLGGYLGAQVRVDLPAGQDCAITYTVYDAHFLQDPSAASQPVLITVHVAPAPNAAPVAALAVVEEPLMPPDDVVRVAAKLHYTGFSAGAAQDPNDYWNDMARRTEDDLRYAIRKEEPFRRALE